MAKNKLLKELFPPKVQKTVSEVLELKGPGPSGGYDTRWSFLNADKEAIGASTDLGAHTACFAGFKGTFKKIEEKKPGEARYFHYKPPKRDKVSAKQKQRWYELGLDVGIIFPTGQSAKEIHKDGVIIDMYAPELTVGHFYATLTFVRDTVEHPHLVINTLALVDKAGCDFWAAYSFCHGHNMSVTGHAILPFGKSVYNTAGKKSIDYPLTLHEFCAKPTSIDKRIFGETIQNSNWYWSWHSTIKPKNKFSIVSDPLMLLSEELKPLWNSTTKKQAKEVISRLKKDKKGKISFENTRSK